MSIKQFAVRNKRRTQRVLASVRRFIRDTLVVVSGILIVLTIFGLIIDAGT